jgi:predicted PurR-regulated permease PerM
MPATKLTRLQRNTYRVWFWVGVVVLSAVVLWVLARPLSVIVPPVLVGILLVYLLNPIVGGLRRLHIPRLLGTLIAFALLIGVAYGVGRFLGPMLVEQLSTFAEVAPELTEEFAERLSVSLAELGVDVDLTGQFDSEIAAEQLQEWLGDPEARNALMTVIGGLGGIFSSVVSIVIAMTAGPFIAAYLLWDLPRVRAWATAAVPPAHRDEVIDVARRLSDVVGGFIRGQLLVAAYVGIATSIGLAIVGLPFWLVLGVIAGITNLVPLIGPFIAGLLGVLIALFVDGVGLAIAVVIVMTIVQQGDNQIVSPLVMGRTVRLHPLVVLLALLVAGVLYGIFGLLIAVPVVAALNVLGAHLWATRVPWADADETDADADVDDTDADAGEQPVEGAPVRQARRSEPGSEGEGATVRR